MRLNKYAQAVFALWALGSGALSYAYNADLTFNRDKLWPGGVVYFTFAESQGRVVEENFRQLYIDAMAKIEKESEGAVIFVQLKNEGTVANKPYVLEIIDVLSGPHGEGGAATLGAHEYGSQLFVMSQVPDASHSNTARHELMHVLGFDHPGMMGSCIRWGQSQDYINVIKKEYAGEQAKRQNRQLIAQSVAGAEYLPQNRAGDQLSDEQTANHPVQNPTPITGNKTDLFIRVAGKDLCLEAEARFSWWLQDKQKKERFVKAKTCKKGEKFQQWTMNADKKIVNLAYPDLCLGRVIDKNGSLSVRAGFVGLTYCKQALQWQVSEDGTQLLDVQDKSLMLTHDKVNTAVALWWATQYNHSTWSLPFKRSDVALPPQVPSKTSENVLDAGSLPQKNAETTSNTAWVSTPCPRQRRFPPCPQAHRVFYPCPTQRRLYY